MKTNMSLIGRTNKANGSLFEKWISSSCEYYAEQDIAFIEKTPEPFHITGKDRNGVVSGYYAKAAQPDYKGILKGGKGIMFEAKHTDTDAIMHKAVTEKQAEELDIFHKLGAVCFVLVSIKFEGFYRVPWTVWQDMKARFGHLKMTAEELEPYRVWSNIERIDFLADIDRFEQEWGHKDGDGNGE